MNNLFRKFISFFIAIIVMIFIWIIVIVTINPPEYILPTPIEVLSELYNNYNNYLSHTISTIWSVLYGLVLGIFIGVFLAVLSILARQAKSVIESFSVIIRTLPIVAIAPIIIICLGTERLAQIIIVTLVCFFPVFAATLRGMERADTSAIKLFKLYNSSKLQLFYNLQLPTAIPSIINSIPMAITLAILGALVAEFTGYDKGLGSLVLRGLYNLNAKMLYASNVLAALLGILAYLFSFLLQLPFRRFIITRDIESVDYDININK